MVISHLGSSSIIKFVPYEQACASGFQDMMRRKPIVAKLSRYVGFQPATPLAEIIRQTAAFGE
jgi:UDP-glucose 4-epimerase